MSLRHKLSRLWERGTDDEQLAPEATAHLATASDSPPQSASSPRRLHKAASTTFKAFSSSIRSRAQSFYVGSTQGEAGPPSAFEPRTPRKPGHASVIWSSVTSRGSRKTQSTLNDGPVALTEYDTPTRSAEQSAVDPDTETSSIEYKPIGDKAPRIDTEIPRSSLEDSYDEGDDVTATTMTMSSTLRCEPKQLWPSALMCLRGLTLVEQASPLVVDDKQTPQQPSTPLPSRYRMTSIGLPVEGYGRIKDHGAAGDASTFHISAPEPPASLQSSSNDCHTIKTNRKSSEDYAGTFWPAAKVLKSSKRHSTSADTPPVNIEPFPGTGSQYQSSISAYTESPQVQHTSATHEPTRLSSASYEADNEGRLGSLEANMGSREPWEKAQADRRRRHAALEPMCSTSEDDSESVPVNERTLDNDSDTCADLSCGPGQLAQTDANSSSHSTGQAIPIEQYLETSFEGSSISSAFKMTKKIKSTTNRDAVQAESCDGIHPKSPSSSSKPAQVLSYHEYKTNTALRHQLHERGTDVILREDMEEDLDGSRDFLVTTQLDPNDPFEKAMASAKYAMRPSDEDMMAAGISTFRKLNDVSSNTSRTYDADVESDPSDSDQDIAEAGVSSKFARYTSTPPRSTRSDSPPREVGRIYTTFYASSGRSGSPSDEKWLKEHYARVDDYIMGESEKYFDRDEGIRQRYAESLEGQRTASVHARCQFIYLCEHESQGDADAETSGEESSAMSV
ncbi:MAG: hypothetical protein Q9213_000409 [Squamulea squamosa]